MAQDAQVMEAQHNRNPWVSRQLGWGCTCMPAGHLSLQTATMLHSNQTTVRRIPGWWPSTVDQPGLEPQQVVLLCCQYVMPCVTLSPARYRCRSCAAAFPATSWKCSATRRARPDSNAAERCSCRVPLHWHANVVELVLWHCRSA